MMKNILICLFVAACSHSKKMKIKTEVALPGKDLYRVIRIDSINNYYLIYTRRNEHLYKIVSEKLSNKRCKNIVVGEEYAMQLFSALHSELMIGGRNFGSIVISNLDGVVFDDSTTIFLERDSITDLFRTPDLRGLCLEHWSSSQ